MLSPLKIRVFSIVFLSICCFSTSIQAATLQLVGGQKIEGNYLGGTKDVVQLKVGSQIMKFKVQEISAISFDSNAPAAPTGGFNTSAKEVLRQLKSVSSVCEAGVSYGNYGPRVLDAKVKVSEFLDEYKDSPKPDFNGHVSTALCYYTEAAKGWSARISNSFDQVPSSSCARQCKVGEMRMLWYGESGADKTLYSVLGEFALPDLWTCAKEEISAAETLLKK